MDVWQRYDAWNEAIVDVVFPELETPEPVYLDFEDEITDALAVRMGVGPDDVVDDISAAVSGTLPDLGPSWIFARHVRRLTQWERSGRAGLPPHVALLSVFSLAAEQMSHGEGMSSSNYFGRLRAVLGYAPDDRRVDDAYRRVAERMWSSLNIWLTDLDGARGIPTAFALRQRFVGLPISQALVRHADREKLKTFFREYGFAPGADVPPADLEQVLDSWIQQRPCPVSHNLERLWNVKAARGRIATGAAVALSAWDGSVTRTRGESLGRATGHIALTLEVGTFPVRRFGVSALFYLPDAGLARRATVLSADPEAALDLVPDVQGALGLSRGSELNVEDVLGGVLKVRDEVSGATMEHRPRRLMLFREDDQSRRWIESPQVMLGESVRLVVEEGLLPRLRDVLSTIARPGWSVESEAYPGQPRGWSLVRGVEILQPPGGLVKHTGIDDLLPLVPLTSSALKIAGGFALPGQVKGKWHSWAPPEIRAVSDAEGGFRVTLTDLRRFETIEDAADKLDPTLLEKWSDGGAGVIVVSMDGLELEDGDYRIELVPAGSDEASTSTVVRLRSSETPDERQWALLESVAYSSGAGAIGLLRSDDSFRVQGATVQPVLSEPLGRAQVPESPSWKAGTSRSTSDRTPVRLTMPDAGSCIYTGSHKMWLETPTYDAKGNPRESTVLGTCRTCGLERRERTRHQRAKPHQVLPVPRRDALTHVAPATRGGSILETAFDAMLHVGGGSWSHFERIALQVEPTALYVDQLARALEALAHIDVRRRPADLAPSAWEVAPTVLATIARGAGFFAGFWPDSLYTPVREAVEAVAGRVVAIDPGHEAPTSYFAEREDGLDASVIAGTEARFVERAWSDVAHALPCLGRLVEELPRQRESFVGSISWFRPSDNSWMPVKDCEVVGAFRVRQFGTVDFVRTSHDLEAGDVRLSTVQLSKHVAAMLSGKPLIAYDKAHHELIVPLGADLPGLYGRAAVLASGRPPTPDKPNRALRYHDVPVELAEHLYDIFSR